MGLAYKLMKSDLHRHVKILYTIQNACWDWYVMQVHTIKAPEDGCKYSLTLAGHGWQTEPHLWLTTKPLRDALQLRFMGIPLGESKWATKALELAWHTVGRRSWSLAKHSAPPECLVGVLSSTEATRNQTLRELETGHRNFLLLERRAVDSEDASCLRRDMIFLDSDAVRLMFEFYARDKYAPTSIYGRNAVMAYHWTLPDNKIVEDIHQPLRLNARGNMNKRLASQTIQGIILESNVLEARNVRHPIRITKTVWVSSAKLRRTDLKHKFAT